MPEDVAPGLPRGEIRVRLELSPSLRELLARVVQQVHAARANAPDFPGPTPARPADASDPDLQAAWAEGLRERDDYDTKALLDLLAHPKFGVEGIPLSPSAAEAIARASAATRLHLRESLLRRLTSEQAEGHLEVLSLSLPEQHGYACFRLLAFLEEDLLVQLDPGLLKT